jgi:hypothetical protein
MASTTPQATDDEPLALRARIERLLEAAPEERGSLETIMAALDVLTNKVAALEKEAFGPGADAGADAEPGAGGVTGGVKRPRADALVELAAELAVKRARVDLQDLPDEWGVKPTEYLAHPKALTLPGHQRFEYVEEQRYVAAKSAYEALREKLNKPDRHGITPEEYKEYGFLKLLKGFERFPRLEQLKARGNEQTCEVYDNADRRKMTQLEHEGAADRKRTVVAEHHSNGLMDASLDKPLSKLIFGEQPGSLLKRIERIVKSAVAPGQPGPDASPDA